LYSGGFARRFPLESLGEKKTSKARKPWVVVIGAKKFKRDDARKSLASGNFKGRSQGAIHEKRRKGPEGKKKIESVPEKATLRRRGDSIGQIDPRNPQGREDLKSLCNERHGQCAKNKGLLATNSFA